VGSCNHGRFDSDCSCCAEWAHRKLIAQDAELEKLHREVERWRSDDAVVELRANLAAMERRALDAEERELALCKEREEMRGLILELIEEVDGRACADLVERAGGGGGAGT
jgi:hypothetical protein